MNLYFLFNCCLRFSIHPFFFFSSKKGAGRGKNLQKKKVGATKKLTDFYRVKYIDMENEIGKEVSSQIRSKGIPPNSSQFDSRKVRWRGKGKKKNPEMKWTVEFFGGQRRKEKKKKKRRKTKRFNPWKGSGKVFLRKKIPKALFPMTKFYLKGRAKG